MSHRFPARATGCLLLCFAGMAMGQECKVDLDCDDHDFCNGIEHCAPGRADADARGCYLASPRCLASQACNDAERRCVTLRTDEDGDGHASILSGGDDCNDRDVAEFPGNPEAWDDADHDEDCNARTHGFTPGFGTTVRSGIFKVCSGVGRFVRLDGEVGGEATFTEEPCAAGQACQGNGTCAEEAFPGQVAASPVRPAPHDQVMSVQAMASAVPAPSVLSPMPRGPLLVAPMPIVTAPAAPAAASPKSCADGMYFDEKAQACAKK
jgi:hypothetical protein